MKIFKGINMNTKLEEGMLLVTRCNDFKFAKIMIKENDNKIGVQFNGQLNKVFFYNKKDMQSNFHILDLRDGETEEENEFKYGLLLETEHINISSNFNIYTDIISGTYNNTNNGLTIINNGETKVNSDESKVKVETKKQVRENIKTSSNMIYGIDVKRGINQTSVWKILKAICEKRDEEGIKVANELKKEYPVIFSNSKRCLASKKKIEYIESITC